LCVYVVQKIKTKILYS